MTKCDRCGKSTKSPKAAVCRSCLQPEKVLEWLTRTAVRLDDCLLIKAIGADDDGRYRVQRMRGETKTTGTVHMMLWELLDRPMPGHEHRLVPTCGRYGCLTSAHWRVERILTLKDRLTLVIELLEEVYETAKVEFDDELHERIEAALAAEGRLNT